MKKEYWVNGQRLEIEESPFQFGDRIVRLDIIDETIYIVQGSFVIMSNFGLTIEITIFVNDTTEKLVARINPFIKYQGQMYPYRLATDADSHRQDTNRLVKAIGVMTGIMTRLDINIQELTRQLKKENEYAELDATSEEDSDNE